MLQIDQGVSIDAVTKVVSGVAFVTALDHADINLDEHDKYEIVICQMCKVLSLENFTDENFDLLETHLRWFCQQWPSAKK